MIYYLSMFVRFTAPKLKGRKRRKKLSCYQLNETSSVGVVEHTETRAKTVSTLQQVTHSLHISLICICAIIMYHMVDGLGL